MVDLRNTERKRLKRRSSLGLLSPRGWGLRRHLCPVLRRLGWLGPLLILVAAPAFSQYTTVSANVKDPNGVPYASGAWQANLDTSGVAQGRQVSFQGSNAFQTSYSGQLDSAGHFSISLPDNNVVTPVGATQWAFKFCQFYTTSTQSPAPACFNLTLTVTGASMDITSQVQAASVNVIALVVVPVASGTITLGTASIGSGACAAAVTATAPAVLTTDIVKIGFSGDPTAIAGYGVSASGAVLTIYPYVEAGDVAVKVCNSTSGAITPGALTLNWKVER